MVDILNCQKGCIRGTATDEKIDDIDVELAINEIQHLLPKKLIGANEQQAANTLPKIAESIEQIKKLLDSIYALNERVVNIAATTEEIAVQSDTIRNLSDDR